MSKVFSHDKGNIERLKEILYGHVTQEEIVFNIERLIKQCQVDVKKTSSEKAKVQRYEELVSSIQNMLQGLK